MVSLLDTSVLRSCFVFSKSGERVDLPDAQNVWIDARGFWYVKLEPDLRYG